MYPNTDGVVKVANALTWWRYRWRYHSRYRSRKRAICR